MHRLLHRAQAVLVLATFLGPGRSVAQPLAHRIEAIMARPEFRRSYFGMAFVDLATGKPVYRYNADKFFVPGSTTKVPTAASALRLLGADYRFHTRVYRTGPIVNGGLEGDLVLVASGDPNLSGRLRPDGTLAFTNEDHSYGNMVLKGAIPVGGKGMMLYRVPEPSRFAEFTLADLLQEAGIAARPRLAEQRVDHDQLSSHYVSDHQVAEHISAPMTQVVKVVLKVSQNLHASMMPYVLGGLLAKEGTTAAGFKKVREWETKAGFDLTGQSQGDGAGAEAHFAPDFMVSLLRYMATQTEFQSFFNALPVLGRDGTLAAIQVTSPAAGQVHAKTGTFGETDRVGPGTLVNGKGLAGYIDTKDGRRLAFAIYINNTHVAKDADVQGIVGQAIGEIAAEAWAGR